MNFSLQTFGITFQIITAIIGSIYFYKYKKTFLKYFLIILWYIAINDLLGFFLRNNDYPVSILYNIYYLVVFNYLMFLFKNYITNMNHKKMILTFMFVYTISFFINGIFGNYLIQDSKTPYIIGASFLVISIIFYYMDILNSEKVLHVKKNLLFWISTGVLIYYCGNIPYKIVKNYAGDLRDIHIEFLVLCILTIVMNLCFIIGFVWSDNKQQY
ncbi:hypothetical protein GCM10007384_13640 [Aquimarina muelleri]|uniref:Uncharacterized protein n=2 Tax=Aquimarina muelleri TaxID=279356 RepID=A0A918N3Q2_9FLAO|nr:hypothetical protein GCM10007384_13640 [Aquimarina muelleri]